MFYPELFNCLWISALFYIRLFKHDRLYIFINQVRVWDCIICNQKLYCSLPGV